MPETRNVTFRLCVISAIGLVSSAIWQSPLELKNFLIGTVNKFVLNIPFKFIFSFLLFIFISILINFFFIFLLKSLIVRKISSLIISPINFILLFFKSSMSSILFIN